MNIPESKTRHQSFLKTQRLSSLQRLWATHLSVCQQGAMILRGTSHTYAQATHRRGISVRGRTRWAWSPSPEAAIGSFSWAPVAGRSVCPAQNLKEIRAYRRASLLKKEKVNGQGRRTQSGNCVASREPSSESRAKAPSNAISLPSLLGDFKALHNVIFIQLQIPSLGAMKKWHHCSCIKQTPSPSPSPQPRPRSTHEFSQEPCIWGSHMSSRPDLASNLHFISFITIHAAQLWNFMKRIKITFSILIR